MRKSFIGLLIFGIIGLWSVPPGFASTSVDALMQKLVEKGILTDKEVRELKEEIATDEKLIREEGYKQGLPTWIQNTNIKGDFRLRHEFSKRNDSSDQDRSRGRIRYRLGFETKINDQTKAAAGLASNGGSPRSTNQTFTDAFAKSAINLDYAYAEFKPYTWLTMTGGKMKMPIWEAGDLLWDTDITPEGGALNLNMNTLPNLTTFFNMGAFVLDESAADQTDPFLLVFEPGVQWKTSDEAVDLKLALAYYSFSHGAPKSVLDNRSSPTTNTVTGGRYDHKYDSINPNVEFGINNPFKSFDLPIAIPRIAIFGEYVNNPDPENDNAGWLVGGYIGDKKVAGPNQWQVKGSYRSLGKDAWLDAFPDSDFYGGATDVKGYETIFEYGLNKNTSIALDYYRTQRIKAVKAPETVLQADLNFKF